MRRNRAERKDWDESTRVDGGTYKKRTHCQHSNRARVVRSSLELRGPRLAGWAEYTVFYGCASSWLHSSGTQMVC